MSSKKDTPSAPRELLSLCTQINTEWLAPAHRVDPYLMDGGSEWRLRVSTSSGGFVDYLVPETADGHTYMLMASAVDRAFNAGIGQGLELAHKRISDVMLTAITGHELPSTTFGHPLLTKV